MCVWGGLSSLVVSEHEWIIKHPQRRLMTYGQTPSLSPRRWAGLRQLFIILGRIQLLPTRHPITGLAPSY